MHRVIPLALSAACLLLGVTGASAAQDGARSDTIARVVGRVTDHATKRPVTGAIVSIAGVQGRVLTDDRGGFTIDRIPAGARVLTVEMLGYASRSQAISLRGGAVHDVDVVLARQAIELEPIDVSVRSGFLQASGFYERERSSGGDFFTRDDIERRRASELTDILRSVPGARIHLLETGQRHVRFNRSVGETLAFDISTEVLPGCEPDLYIDGAVFRQRMPQNPSEHRLDNFDVLGVAEIEGIEVYTGPEAPLRYQSPCGVILIWTRRGIPVAASATSAAKADLLPDLPAGTLVRVTPRLGDRYTGTVTTSEGDVLVVDDVARGVRSIDVNELRRIERSLGRAGLGESTWRGARWGLVVGLVGIAFAAAAEEFNELGEPRTGHISTTSPRNPAFGAKVVGATTVIGAFLGGSLWRYQRWVEVHLR